MRRLDRSARSALLRGRGERRSPVSAALATAAVTTSSVAAPAGTASITTSTVSATITAASASADTAAITTTTSSTDAIPGELDAHVYSARVDIRARVWRVWPLGSLDGWLLDKRDLAGSVRSVSAVRRAPVHAYGARCCSVHWVRPRRSADLGMGRMRQ